LLLVSRAGAVAQDHHDPGDRAADLTAAAAANSMTSRERRIFRFTLAALAIVWLAVIVTFSPWGVARAG
jgi:fatty acid desaturase